MQGINIETDMLATLAVAVGDMDGDGWLDLVAANNGINNLYLNQGVFEPLNNFVGNGITSDDDWTTSIALGDIDNDGNLDIVAGNLSQANRLYLSNGGADPFGSVNGSNITADTDDTYALALGDVDNDGDLDLVVGNLHNESRLYHNNGTATPFAGIAGEAITNTDLYTQAIILGDVNNDGYLDLITGSLGDVNRLYLNNRTNNPFSGITAKAIGAEKDSTSSLALQDIDADGDLDLFTGNLGAPNRLYLNNGTTDPFSDAFGIDLAATAYNTRAVATADMDRDGLPDFVAGNEGSQNVLYRRNLYNTGHGRVTSLEVDTEGTDLITNATLTQQSLLPSNTAIRYFLSNNGGERYFQVYPGRTFIFPTRGNDLRWSAQMDSLSPRLTPFLQGISITNENTAPQASAGAILAYTEDDTPTVIDVTIVLYDENDANLESADIHFLSGYQPGEDQLNFTDAYGITGTWNTNLGVLTLLGTSSVNNYQSALRSVTYHNTDTGNPTVGQRIIAFVVNDGETTSDVVTSTVEVTRVNDAPVINPLSGTIDTVQNAVNTISIDDPGADIYIPVIDADNTLEDLSLLILSGENYYVAGSTVTPAPDYVGPLSVPVLVGDGTTFSAEYIIVIQVNDVVAPAVASITRVQSDPTNAVDVDFLVSFSESVTGVTTDDFSCQQFGTLSGAAVTGLVGSGNTYTATVSGYSGEGTLRIDLVDDNTIQDTNSGNALAGSFSGGQTYTIDRTLPQVNSIYRSDANPTSADTVHFTVTFSEQVSGVNTNDFTLPIVNTVTGGNIITVSPDAGTLSDTFTVTVYNYSGEGNLRIDLVNDGSITDDIGNVLSGSYSNGEAYTIDMVPPVVVSIERVDANPTNAAEVHFTVTFSEPIFGVDTSDFSLAGSIGDGFITAATFVHYNIYEVTVSAYNGEGSMRLDLIDNDTIIDQRGTPPGGSGFINGDFTIGQSYSIHRTAPLVSSITRVDGIPQQQPQR